MLSPISTLPKDVLKCILRILSPEEMGRVCTVSKLWNQCASEIYYPLADLFRTFTFVRKDDLNALGVSLENPYVTRDVYRRLKTLVYKNIRVRAEGGITLTTNFVKVGQNSTGGGSYMGIGFNDLVQIGGPLLKLIEERSLFSKDIICIDLEEKK